MKLLGVLVAFFMAGEAFAAGGPYLFELLEQQPYRAAWSAMLQSSKLPEWLQGFGTNGVTNPSEEEWIAGAEFRYAVICEPHNCAWAQFHVLFAPNAARAWGLLISDGKTTWFGEPDEYVRAALTKRAQE